MDRLQSRLYTLLSEMDDICRRNGIVYYLAGGTALGAVRGGGFLPWDDDIDLYITRDNWKRLVKVMEDETPEGRLFVCIENSDLYMNPVGRYVDRETTVMMKSQLLCGRACGQLLEFFIFDPMPEGEEAMWQHRKLVKTYTELLTPYFVTGRDILEENRDYDPQMYRRYERRARLLGRQKVLDQLLDRITSVREEDSSRLCMRWGIKTYIYDRDMFGTPRMEKFEDGMFPVPEKQEMVARIAYGDSWMYVPEGSGKVVHGLDKDLETPFSRYTDMYMPLLDRRKLLKKFRKSKEIRAGALYRKNTLRREFALARARAAALRIEREDASYNRRLLDEGRYGELSGRLSYFTSQQYHPDIRVCHIPLPVDDGYLYTAAELDIREGRYYRCMPVLKWRRDTGRPMTDELMRAEEEASFCREVSVAIYDRKDRDLVEELLGSRSDMKDLMDYARAHLWILREKGLWEELLREAEDALSDFPGDGEIMRYRGLAMYSLGRKDEAREIYMSAVQHTRNGFVWREASDLFGIDAYDMADCREREKKMTERACIYRDMLLEIDDICRENGLAYALDGYGAAELLEGRGFPEDLPGLTVVMTGGDIERFEQIVNGREDPSRQVEWIFNNPRARDMQVRYCNSDTTSLFYKDAGRHVNYGMHVEIRTLKRPLPEGRQASKLRFLKAALRGGCKDLQSCSPSRYLPVLLLKAAGAVIGREHFSHMLYDCERSLTFMDEWDREAAPVTEVSMDGRTVTVLSEPAGSGDISKSMRYHMMNFIEDTETSFRDVVPELHELETMRRERNLYLRTVTKAKASGRYTQRAWRIYLMTRDVADNEDRYDEACRAHLDELVRAGDREEYRREIDDYISSKERWTGEGIPFIEDRRLEDVISRAEERFGKAD